MDLADLITGVGLVLGAFFFFAGSIGVLRFPDVYNRIHALSKADNLGLGLVVVSLAFQATSWMQILKLLFIWLLVLMASATTSFLVARTAKRKGILPWTR